MPDCELQRVDKPSDLLRQHEVGLAHHSVEVGNTIRFGIGREGWKVGEPLDELRELRFPFFGKIERQCPSGHVRLLNAFAITEERITADERSEVVGEPLKILGVGLPKGHQQMRITSLRGVAATPATRERGPLEDATDPFDDPVRIGRHTTMDADVECRLVGPLHGKWSTPCHRSAGRGRRD